ncbi:MAG: dipeptidase [Bryobacteraceae bacterium]|nr:dipeptidase [Bryobacteraceae bacterium]
MLPLLLVLAQAGSLTPQARELHRRAFVFDAHVHVVNRQFYQGGSLGDRQTTGQVDLPRMRESGLDALFFSLFVPEDYYPQRHETRQTLRLLAEAHRQLDLNRDRIGLARNASDIVKLNRQGRIAAVLDLEGGFDMDGDLGVLRMLYQLGLRSFQLPAHNYANSFAESCCAAGPVKGLTEQGRAVIREANRLGMVINIAHASEAAMEQAIETSADPVLSTHDGLKYFNDIPRTMSEGTLRKLAAKGGLIGFHMGNEFHHRPLFEYRQKLAGKPFWEREEAQGVKSVAEIDRLVAPRFPMVGLRSPPAELLLSVEQWFRVVDKAIEWVGDDYVMLGTDFDGGPTLPKPMRDIRDLPWLTQAMLNKGYPEARIRKFLGGNLLRVFRQVTESGK